MSSTVNEMQKIMQQIHALHREQYGDNEDFYTEYEELNEQTESPSYRLFEKMQHLVSDHAEEALQYFATCELLDFCIYAFHATIYCYEKSFYCRLLEVWEKRAPHGIKEDVMYALLEAQSYVEGHR